MELKFVNQILDSTKYLFHWIYGDKPNIVVYIIEVMAIGIVSLAIAGALIMGTDFFTYEINGYTSFRYSIFLIIGANGWFFLKKAKLFDFDQDNKLEVPLLHIQATGLNLFASVVIVSIFYVIVNYT